MQNADLIFIKNYDKIYLQGKEMMLSTLPKKIKKCLTNKKIFDIINI